ncbi:MAG TPA: hypothetical protein VFH90_02515 [Candidatus Limnocylindria bacterium]|nr:hypothetical protein [Candidatus Limnocylindria bacterium]
MPRAIRLAFRMQRFELGLLLGAVLLVCVAALGIAWQTRVLREEQLACFREAPPAVEGSSGTPCPDQDEALQLLEQGAAFAKAGVLLTPFVLGLFLGVPVVAREIEGRTAGIAWTLDPSRRRWLLTRGGPVIAAAVLASLVAGVAGEVVARSAPWAEGVGLGFTDYGARGELVAVRALAVASVGLVMGALVPRQLPALLLAGAASLALFVAVTIVMDGWMEAAAEPIAVGPMQDLSGKIYGSAMRDDATGLIVNEEEWFLANPDPVYDEFGMPVGTTMIYYMVPGWRYGEFVLRESALLGVVAALAMVTSAAVVSVRRP